MDSLAIPHPDDRTNRNGDLHGHPNNHAHALRAAIRCFDGDTFVDADSFCHTFTYSSSNIDLHLHASPDIHLDSIADSYRYGDSHAYVHPNAV